jgi:hypothetical protein
MSNALYDKYRQSALEGGIAILTANIKFVLVDVADYTVNLATHQFLSDIASAGRVSTSPNAAGKTSTAGVFDANDITFAAVSGDPSEAVVGYVDTGTATTSNLICYIDTATGLPVTPNGGDITVTWDNGANKIFKL